MAVSIAERTGRKIELTALQHGCNEFVPWGKSDRFEWYEVEDYPVAKAILGRVFYEVEWKQREQSAEDAFAAAKAEMQSSIERQLPSLAKLVDLSCRTEASTQDMIAVRATACVVEEIGVTRVWQGGPSEVDR